MLAPDFKETLCEVVKVVKPFVHWSVIILVDLHCAPC